MPANARMTEQEALNVILSKAGEQPVNALVNLPRNATRAFDVLKEIVRDVQEDPNFWNFNTEHEKVLSPDIVTGKIQVATNVVSISRFKLRQDFSQELTLRGEFVYDITKSTDVFTADITVDMRIMLEWDDLPVQARRYMTLRAAREYQERFIEDPIKRSFDIAAETRARAKLIGAETREQNLSMLNNPSLQRANNRLI